ncbi:MAG: hypothetical protein A2782_02260 [Candidatus Blackburnbacteria bacterium RIFCSPHIGHO2_01_FULL_43_15b]|uniref:Nudix hydrolase domain-containing protein n=1 Tax=Candidatus Blackburnbacteria bacterium RIFCSPHIGHO2_01_FULL_43_15b TaxID=1797513 RepID=A0A1G1V089_9BACT|nr:MAG: hypothetical protein A2782_02260 [Candidatus Blackburnbacteria bacterium RIFCSPHIGHO2_01_FULL_43_15b]
MVYQFLVQLPHSSLRAQRGNLLLPTIFHFLSNLLRKNFLATSSAPLAKNFLFSRITLKVYALAQLIARLYFQTHLLESRVVSTERRESTLPRVEVYRALIVNQSGQVLLGLRAANDGWAANQWEAFGGKREPGQAVGDVLPTEVMEEAGLSVSFGNEPIYTASGALKGKLYIVQYHLAWITGGKLKLNEEHQKPSWFSLEDALSLENLTDQARSAITALQQVRG